MKKIPLVGNSPVVQWLVPQWLGHYASMHVSRHAETQVPSLVVEIPVCLSSTAKNVLNKEKKIPLGDTNSEFGTFEITDPPEATFQSL